MGEKGVGFAGSILLVYAERCEKQLALEVNRSQAPH